MVLNYLPLYHLSPSLNSADKFIRFELFITSSLLILRAWCRHILVLFCLISCTSFSSPKPILLTNILGWGNPFWIPDSSTF
jgi:hypothetical protein